MMRRFFARWLPAAALLLIGFPHAIIAGQGFGDAGQPGEYLYYGTDIRSLAMGRTYVALSGDAASIFSNPAGLLGSNRTWNGYFMHYNPFHTSRYNAAAFSLIRPDTTSSGLQGFFFGPDAAWGIGAVELRSDDYEYRDAADRFDGTTFGLYQQAFYAAFARRQMIRIGGGDFACRLDAGVGFKVTREGFSGLNDYDADNGSGLDFGVQIRFIHPWPFSRFLPLRLLLPLRLGASVQNVFLRPHMGMGRTEDKFPTVYRFGFTYLIDITDAQRVRIAGDADKQDWDDRSWGYHLGAELQLCRLRLPASLRAGAYYQSGIWRPTIGAGIGKTINDRLEVQIDYAHEFRANLDDDERFAVRLAYGLVDDARARYIRASELKGTDKNAASCQALDALACYPYTNDAELTEENGSAVIDAARLLGDSLDVERRLRYAKFIGESYYARLQVREARRLLRESDTVAARQKAVSAIDEFTNNVESPDNDDNVFWGEAYLILAETSPEQAAKHAENALDHLPAETGDAYIHYLKGRCWQLIGGPEGWDNAADQYTLIEPGDDDAMSLYKLALVGRAACYSDSSRYLGQNKADSLINHLKMYVAGHDLGKLVGDYPPYPVYNDRQLADDAQLFIGDLYRNLKDTVKARAAYADVCRFYPASTQCTNNHANEKLEQLGK